MAKIQVSLGLLNEVLFPGADLQICGAGVDYYRGVAELVVVGPGVPEADEVTCVVTETQGVRIARFSEVRR